MYPKITVITPTRNRAHTLNRVFKSLKNQTYKNFEWLVCDDASNDKTLHLLKKYKKKSKFNIRIFHYKKRAGKPKIDNFCLKKAKGEFVVFADSDDGFKKNSFKDFINEWKKIPYNKKSKIFAIVSRCLNPNGKPLEQKLNLKNKSISYIDLIYKHKRNIEKWLFINKKILTKYKFPEIDFYVPEGLIWSKISLKYNLWVLDECYRIFYTDTQNSITHSKKINYSIGQLKALEMFIKSKFTNNKSYFNLINFYRFKFINNLFFNHELKNKIKINLILKIFFSLIGFILFTKDYLFLNIQKEKFIKNNQKPIEIILK
jgi:glycosyltransferase involved in cell wall biosynthesis